MCLNPFEDYFVISRNSSQRILVSNCWMFHMMLKVHRRPKWEGWKGAFPITSQRHGSQFGGSASADPEQPYK